jgi:serralysin
LPPENPESDNQEIHMSVANSQNPADALNSLGMYVYKEFTAYYGETYHSIQGEPQQSTVVGTPGNDVITGVHGNAELIGGGGNDALLGGAGNMTLVASTDTTHPFDSQVSAAGSDQSGNFNVLVGGPNDALVGGPGQDAFVFGSHSGHNVVENFNPSADFLVIQSQINGSSIVSAADLSSHIADSKEGTVLNFGGGDDVLLAGVHPNQLQQNDFVFV